MSNSKFNNIKVHVPTPYISKLVQEKLFQLGYKWSLSGCTVNYTDALYLFVENSNIFYNTDSYSFKHAPETQVHYLQILTEDLEGKLFKYTDKPEGSTDYVYYLSEGYAFWVDESKGELTSTMFESNYYNHIKDNSYGIVNLNVNEEVIKQSDNTLDNNQGEENTMKINELDYVRVDALNLEELHKFEKHCNDQGYGIRDTPKYVINFWNHYGVYDSYLAGYNDLFEHNCGVDITEQFLEYLNSLENGENDKGVVAQVTSTEEQDNNLILTVKERLLALADGKALEYVKCLRLDGSVDWETLEKSQTDFGEILYDDEYKVRIKVKDPINEAFREYCFDKGYDREMTDFATFKAGYEAAKKEG